MESYDDIDYDAEKAEKFRLKYGRTPSLEELLFFGSEKEEKNEELDIQP